MIAEKLFPKVYFNEIKFCLSRFQDESLTQSDWKMFASKIYFYAFKAVL